MGREALNLVGLLIVLVVNHVHVLREELLILLGLLAYLVSLVIWLKSTMLHLVVGIRLGCVQVVLVLVGKVIVEGRQKVCV